MGVGGALSGTKPGDADTDWYPTSYDFHLYAVRSYDCFEASDASIEAMNGQFLCNRPISVGYAFKKESKGEGR